MGDFQIFAQNLPNSYKERFARLGTFHKLSNNKGVLEYADFELALDVFAEMVVDEVDIDINIIKKTKPNAINMSEIEMKQESSDDSFDDGMDALTRLETWRKTKKHKNENVDRQLVVGNRTPTSRGHRSSIFGGIDLSFIGNDENNDYTVNGMLSPLSAEKYQKNKRHIKRVSALHRVRVSKIDDFDLCEDDINNYMKQAIENQVLPENIEEYDNEQLIFLLQHHIRLTFRDAFIRYFIDKNVNGKMLKAMKESEFTENIVLNENGNEEIRDEAIKLYKILND